MSGGSLNLIREAWIPVRRRSGWTGLVRPADFAPGKENPQADPVVALAWPRADFDGACTEFLIGLLAAALRPGELEDWEAIADAPPTPEALNDRLEEIAFAFELGGDGPRAFQDFSGLPDAKPDTPAAALLIDSPGAQTIRNNADLFTKRGGVPALGLAAAAMALITLQSYAPSGGAGHRTSLRGGGPLTTLTDPREEIGAPLWELLWANVPTLLDLDAGGDAPEADWRRVFAWLAPARSSEKNSGVETHPGDVHPLQQFFATPRRIWLEIADDPGVCALTGADQAYRIAACRTRPYGVNYGESWRHVLSPHYRDKQVMRPLHPQPGGFHYRHWLGFVGGSAQDRAPALMVARASQRFRAPRLNLAAFGFDMDNMKARSWAEHRMPLFAIDDAEQLAALMVFAEALVAATEASASALIYAIKSAQRGNAKELGGDFSQHSLALWHATEANFFDLLGQRVAAAAAEDRALRQRFHPILRREALDIFDAVAGVALIDAGDIERIATARRGLHVALNGPKIAGPLGIERKTKGRKKEGDDARR